MMQGIDLPGFANPVAGAQATFRAVLDAMSVPGSLHQAGAGLTAPAPLDPATASVLLTLVDGETPLYLDDRAEAALGWIAFHCGAAFTEAARARFAVSLECPDFGTLDAGSDEGPEESCTLILQVDALGSGAVYRLAGPGLKSPIILRADGLPADFAACWAANHRLYPRGIDLILCAGTTITALPRSVRLENG